MLNQKHLYPKIFHFQIKKRDSSSQMTLIARLINGSIIYDYFAGWNSDGQSHALSNLYIDLPIDLKTLDEDQLEFTQRVRTLLTQGGYTIHKSISPHIKLKL